MVIKRHSTAASFLATECIKNSKRQHKRIRRSRKTATLSSCFLVVWLSIARDGTLVFTQKEIVTGISDVTTHKNSSFKRNRVSHSLGVPQSADILTGRTDGGPSLFSPPQSPVMQTDLNAGLYLGRNCQLAMIEVFWSSRKGT